MSGTAAGDRASGAEFSSPDALLGAEGLGRRIKRSWIWRGLFFTVGAGESVAVTGPSGSGKTLLLRALAGLDPFEEGRVLLGGEAAETLAPQRLRARVAFLHQRPALLAPLSRDEAFLQLPASELSGGEQQIVALLRAVQLDPQVLLLDEPTASLDGETAAAVEALHCLGASRWEAAHAEVRGALRVGMIPTINTMMIAGVVALPGMMTGQILGGVGPGDAVRYEIVIMFMIASGTALALLEIVLLAFRVLFDERHRLRLDRLQGGVKSGARS